MLLDSYHRHLEDEEIDAKIILKCFVGKYITVVWAGLKRLEVGLLAAVLFMLL